MANNKYIIIPKAVKIFKDLSAELGEPNRSLLVAKLANPTLSCGTRRKIIPIKKTLIRNANNFIILFISVKL